MGGGANQTQQKARVPVRNISLERVSSDLGRLETPSHIGAVPARTAKLQFPDPSHGTPHQGGPRQQFAGPVIFCIGGFMANVFSETKEPQNLREVFSPKKEPSKFAQDIARYSKGQLAGVVDLDFHSQLNDAVLETIKSGRTAVVMGHSMGCGDALKLFTELNRRLKVLEKTDPAFAPDRRGKIFFVRFDPSYDKYLLQSPEMKNLTSLVDVCISVNSRGWFEGKDMTPERLENPARTKVANLQVREDTHFSMANETNAKKVGEMIYSYLQGDRPPLEGLAMIEHTRRQHAMKHRTGLSANAALRVP